MNFGFLFALFLTLAQSVFSQQYRDVVITAEQALNKIIFNGYSNTIRPSDLVTFNFTLIFKKILSIEERSQQMTSSSNMIV
jgi:hypothetical protein